MSLGTYLLAFYIGVFLDFIKYYVTGPSGSWKTGRTGFSGYSGMTRDTRPVNPLPPPSNQKENVLRNQQNGSFGEQSKNGPGTESEEKPVLMQDSIEEIRPSRKRNKTDMTRIVEEGKGPGPTPRPHRTW